MLQLTLESGARLFLFPQTIKYFKDNKSGYDNQMASSHKKAVSVVVNIQDDFFYVMESVEEIIEMLMPKNVAGNE